ncbi:MAG: RNA polymerase factor sigma-54 [Duncaniella sp.]|nr:RNA polymerase factor sigma-54 [Muribaculum sp.]MCM1255530.1 RNA polymerase factor sigma-54 [Duncaniella sp.]
MKEALKLSLSQKMQQRLSPMQMRFVKMLEMNGPEIEEEVRTELDDNPALEVVDDMPLNDEDASEFEESAEQLQMADYKNEDEIPSYRLEARNNSVNDTYYEPVAVSGDNSLMDYLIQQLSETDISDGDMVIANYIIGNIDDNGYLTRTLSQILDELAFNVGIEITIEHLREIFNRIRQLEPAGICALDLRDCLVLQLKRLPVTEDNKLALEIVSHYFDIFSLRHYDRLVNMLNVTKDQLQRAIDVIKNLDPKPGSHFGGGEEDRLRHIIPDFNVEVDGENLTLSLLNNIPELCIEKSFSFEENKLSRDSIRNEEAHLFIKRKREEASDFIELLRMRQETLFKVMSAIVNWQHEFFITEDENKLRPMILKDISKVTGYDMSMISRATAGKYVATAGGVYPLKFFFNERVTDNDDDTSIREILAMIRELVDNEDSRHPLNDDALTGILHKKGYDIARRTVAKYRERLNIPVARLRKGL